MSRRVMDLDLDTVLTLLECPVCLLPPRAPPIFQCTTGHLVCSECQPSLIRCPICDIKYRSCLTRDFFAEKLLEHLERKCRYQHFGCDQSSKDSSRLVEHESLCDFKPELPVVRKRRKQSNSEEENENDEAEDESDDDEVEEEEEEEIEIEDVFISNFAFILVLLRAYILEFVDHEYASKQPDSLSFEYLLVFLLCAWLYHSWHENGFNLMLDETSPFIAAWFMAITILVMVLKVTYCPWSGESQLAAFKFLVSNMKPCVTLCTGIFSCSVHCYVHNMWREDNVFILSCVLMLSVILSLMEMVWAIQAQMDHLFYVLFWLQSFFIVLPFGLAGRNFMEF